jgi:large subunit ribosomal protein L6
MQLGFSHPVEVEIPSDIELTVEKNNLTIRGINKESVGQFTATVREYKKPEPYKGKGIRYSDEIVRRKEGKKTV